MSDAELRSWPWLGLGWAVAGTVNPQSKEEPMASGPVHGNNGAQLQPRV